MVGIDVESVRWQKMLVFRMELSLEQPASCSCSVAKSLVAVVLMGRQQVMCLLERELVLGTSTKFEFERSGRRTLMAASAG